MTPFQSILVAVLLLSGSTKPTSGEEIPSENGVLILTQQTLAETLQAHEFVLVMFSSVNCGHCHRLMPAYGQVAAVLATDLPDVPVTKVDVSAERSLIAEYGIKTVPDVRLFGAGKPVDKYGGERTKEAIAEWVKGKVAEEGAGA